MVVLDDLFILLNTTLKLKKKRQPATRFHFSAPLLHLDSLPTEA